MADSDIDAGSTAFMFVCMALVQLMTPGLAFFYGGLVRSTNTLTIMFQSFLSLGVVFILWYVVVFSMCFGESIGGVIGNPATYAFFDKVHVHSPFSESVPGIPGALFASYQGMFAVITPALMTGAFADRVCWCPYAILVIAWVFLVYAPVCHWVWGGGWMQQWGVFDFAGGIVVHITSGFSALATLVVLGPRNSSDPDHKQPHSVPFVALGTAMLWFGWFGFNGGSALASNGVAVAAAINSQLAGSVALVGWLICDGIRGKKPGLVGACVGAVAGLATVTPCAGFVPSWGAFVLGIVASVVCYQCVLLVERMHLDDALDVWGVHGMGGFVGSILLGVLAQENVNPGTAARSPNLFLVQLCCSVFTAVYSFGVTFVLLTTMDKIVRIRPSKIVEGDLDKALHGEIAYVTHKSNPDLDVEDGYLSNSDEESSLEFDRQSSGKSEVHAAGPAQQQPNAVLGA